MDVKLVGSGCNRDLHESIGSLREKLLRFQRMSSCGNIYVSRTSKSSPLFRTNSINRCLLSLPSRKACTTILMSPITVRKGRSGIENSWEYTPQFFLLSIGTNGSLIFCFSWSITITAKDRAAGGLVGDPMCHGSVTSFEAVLSRRRFDILDDRFQAWR